MASAEQNKSANYITSIKPFFFTSLALRISVSKHVLKNNYREKKKQEKKIRPQRPSFNEAGGSGPTVEVVLARGFVPGGKILRN
jgi:hypothetical protein